jgi:hypothetical protein
VVARNRRRRHCERSESLAFHDVRFTPGPGATATTEAAIENRNQRVLRRGGDGKA